MDQRLTAGKEEGTMLNRKRRTALLLCAGMVLVLFLSSAFIACEAGHECVGEACKICECVAQTKALLQSFTLLGAVVLALLLLPAVITTKRREYAARGLTVPTLISLKIRLNN